MCCIEGTEDNKGRTQCGPLHLGVLINGPIKGSTVSQNVAQNGNWQVLGEYGAAAPHLVGRGSRTVDDVSRGTADCAAETMFLHLNARRAVVDAKLRLGARPGLTASRRAAQALFPLPRSPIIR